ncbi:glycosyltransferase family 2 protein [Sphingobacterium corticibacter]|uniref:Glycosyl transferase n=1 Tax=Sphingobacterium corticibacter TaxID=2171749 RepID=A0A2T8HJJ3_9SPHI|nr:glycosyltransferase [Sphingobacterium corticibacter]PVH25609.1 glycosyl transferase [Sphingobacterium corticibacter]
MFPKVSILVPIYGVENFIARCAKSLFEQSFENLEYIFVNDCTLDNSIEILNNVITRYPHRKNQIRIIENDHNKGIGETRNTLVSNASGDYVLFVDSDDYLEINLVELMYAKALQEDADIVVCDIWIEWQNYRTLAVQKVGETKVDFLQLLLSAKTMLGLPNKLIKRNLFIENDISVPRGINYGEDFLIVSKLVYFARRITKVDSPLYHYLQTNPESYTTKKLSKNSIDNVIFVLNDLTGFFSNKEDYHLYEVALLRGKLRKKMDLLFYAEIAYLDELIKLFPETNHMKDTSFLLQRDKIIFEMIKKKYLKVFLVYRFIYVKLYNLKLKLVPNNLR